MAGPTPSRGASQDLGRHLTEQILPHRESSSLKPAVRAELGEDVLHIAAQGVNRDVHLVSHLRRALPRHDAAQHLLLPGSEDVQGRGTPSAGYAETRLTG